MSLVDGIFLSALVALTGGYDSILYWLFLALIVRGAVSVPRATSQILLNLTLTACYVMAGVINIYVVRTLVDEARFNAANQTPPHYMHSVTGQVGILKVPRTTNFAAIAEAPARAASSSEDAADDPARENLGPYSPQDNLRPDPHAAPGLAVVDDGLLLRRAGAAGTAAAGGGGGARVRHARGPVALRGACGG